jgi:hypothetical protein
MKKMLIKNIYTITALIGFALGVSICGSVMSCQISIPESYVPTFLTPPVSGHYEKCEKEPCYCVDNANPWTSEFVTEFKQDELGINIETKVFKVSPSRKAAYEAHLLEVKLAEEAEIANKAAAKARIMTFEFKGTSNAVLKAELNAFKEDVKKVLE